MLRLKHYQYNLFKFILKTIPFIFFRKSFGNNFLNIIKEKQLFIKLNVKTYKNLSKISQLLIKKSILKNYLSYFKGSINLLCLRKNFDFYNKFNTDNLILLKINNKIYSRKQLNTLIRFKYINNIEIFKKQLNYFINYKFILPLLKIKKNNSK